MNSAITSAAARQASLSTGPSLMASGTESKLWGTLHPDWTCSPRMDWDDDAAPFSAGTASQGSWQWTTTGPKRGGRPERWGSSTWTDPCMSVRVVLLLQAACQLMTKRLLVELPPSTVCVSNCQKANWSHLGWQHVDYSSHYISVWLRGQCKGKLVHYSELKKVRY